MGSKQPTPSEKNTDQVTDEEDEVEGFARYDGIDGEIRDSTPFGSEPPGLRPLGGLGLRP